MGAVASAFESLEARRPLRWKLVAAPARLACMSRSRARTASDSINEIATVRIELRHSDPLIWREVDVPTSVTLKVLHDIIQATMGWFDYHLWEFSIEGRAYSLPMHSDGAIEARSDASKVRLRDVLAPATTTIDYLYDFGDEWEHRLTVTNVRAGDAAVGYPRYIGGERNGPPEDCGGILGFYELLEALADPSHPNHAVATEWADDYDPDAIDEIPFTIGIEIIANRRNAAKVRIAKKRSGQGES
jgi:hypothetical protein